MKCLMWNVCKYICVSLDPASLFLLSTDMKQLWNGHETGFVNWEKNATLTFYVKELVGKLSTPREKNNKHRVTAKESRGNKDIAIWYLSYD